MSKFSPDSLAARLIAALAPSRVARLRLERGATLLRQGDPALAVYVVEAGRVRLSRMLADGAPLILYVADAGESFAEASLSATHYHCDANAETDPVVLALPKTDLLALMTTDPAQGVPLRSLSHPRCATCAPSLNCATSAPQKRVRSSYAWFPDLRVKLLLSNHARSSPKMPHQRAASRAGT
jgi:Cyclic nucleotide-binding domain